MKLYMMYIVGIIDIVKLFPNPSMLLNYLSGIQYSRFLSETSDTQMFRNAAAFILTYEGIPSIYYGE